MRRLAGLLAAAAAIALGAWLHLPLGPIAFTLQTFFVLLAGYVLGPARGALAAALYLVAGAAGLPVFAGGRADLAVLLGPSGGFLLSFPGMAALAGVATGGRAAPATWGWMLGWGGLASAWTFLLGVPWLGVVLGLGWRETLVTGFWPFLPGALIKLLWAVAAWQGLRQLGALPVFGPKPAPPVFGTKKAPPR